MGRERKNSKQEKAAKKEGKMKIPIVLFVTCVASLNAASFMDSVSDGQCPPQCCDATTTQAPTTTEVATTTDSATTTDGATTTGGATTTDGATETPTTPEAIREATEDPSATTEEPTTPDICSTCDPSTCDKEGGAGSVSLSLLALLLPPVLARLL